MPEHKRNTAKYFKAGGGYGFSQMGQFLAFALMFWVAGWIVKNGFNEETREFDKSPTDVFLALFAVMMGAMHSGYATQFGPDMAKATVAAANIFKILDYPTSIDN